MNYRPILSAILIFITLILGLFLILPKYQDLKSSQIKIKEVQKEIKQWEEYFSNLEKVSQELKNYTEVLSKIDSAIPSEFSLPSLFNFIQKISSQSGLVLKEVGSVTASPISQNSNIQKNSFTVSLSGSYSSLKNFLSILEKSARFLEVESISFSSPTEKEGVSSFSLRIKVHSY